MVFRLAGIGGGRTGADERGDGVEVVFRDGASPEVEGAEFRGVEPRQSGVIENDAGAALGHAVDNFHAQDTLFPVEGQVEIVALKHILTGMAGAHPVGNAGHEGIGRLVEDLGLERRGRIVEREESGAGLGLSLELDRGGRAGAVGGQGHHGDVVGFRGVEVRQGRRLHEAHVDGLVKIAGGSPVKNAIAGQAGRWRDIPREADGALNSSRHEPHVGRGSDGNQRPDHAVEFLRPDNRQIVGGFRPVGRDRGHQRPIGRGQRSRLLDTISHALGRRPGEAHDRAGRGGDHLRFLRNGRHCALVGEFHVVDKHFTDGASHGPGGKIPFDPRADRGGGSGGRGAGHFRPNTIAAGEVDPTAPGDRAAGGNPADPVLLHVGNTGTDLPGIEGKGVGLTDHDRRDNFG